MTTFRPHGAIAGHGVPVLSIQDVSKTYRDRGGASVFALKGVSLTVDAGETVALVGESGSGKSTLAKVALGLVSPDTGWVELAGERVFALSAREVRRNRIRIQPVFQDSVGSFNPRRTVRQILSQAIRSAFDLPGQQVEERSRRLLEQVNIRPPADFLGRFPHELSGGQRQRLAIARAISLEPRVIVADEPLSGADVSIRGRILNLLRDIQKRTNVGYLFITHDIELARVFADRIAVMHEGTIVEEGRAEQVVDAPRHSYTHSLVDAAQSGRRRVDALKNAASHPLRSG